MSSSDEATPLDQTQEISIHSGDEMDLDDLVEDKIRRYFDEVGQSLFAEWVSKNGNVEALFCKYLSIYGEEVITQFVQEHLEDALKANVSKQMFVERQRMEKSVPKRTREVHVCKSGNKVVDLDGAKKRARFADLLK
jgi:hypothetical protein